MADIKYFNGTCDVFDLSTCAGAVLNDQFLDPCSCNRYYRCTQSYKMRTEQCPEDTLWDAVLHQCNHKHEVLIKQKCGRLDSWMRCNTTDDRNKQLEKICTSITTPPSTTPTGSPIETTAAPSGDSSGTNTGLIVGLTLAIVVVIVLIVLFMLYRRKQKSGIKKKRATTTHNPEYFEGGNQDDPYAVIDDRLTNPVYGSQTQGPATNGGFSNTGYDFDDEPATYDNSVVRAPVVSGYTSTLKRSFREYEAPVARQTSDGTLTTTVSQTSDVVNEVHPKTPSTNLDENGNRSSDSSNNDVNVNKKDGGTVERNDGDSQCDSIDLPERNLNEQNDETLHDYLVLNPQDHL